MLYRYNILCSETTSKNWTPTAIDCYSIGCNCSRCGIYKIYFKNSRYKCKMKDVVIELVRRFGKPDLQSSKKGNEHEKSYKYN